jgi:hypothetical protein
VPTRVGSGFNWTSVASGTGFDLFNISAGNYACATNDKGRYCWGSHYEGFTLGPADVLTVPRVNPLR